MASSDKLPNRIIMMNKYYVTSLIVAMIGSAVGCNAQLPYDKFCERVLHYDISVTESIIDGSVHAYYKQYYRMPGSYDDLLSFASNDDRESLVQLCDSLFYKNRQLITFIPNPDSSALLYSGKVVLGLYSQHSCKEMLTRPVSLDIHMVDTGGRSFHDDRIVFIIKKMILPKVYRDVEKTKCKKYFMVFASNTIPCSIPYQYDVSNNTISLVEDCTNNNIVTCSDFDRLLEIEFRKYVFDGIKLITFPVVLYMDDSIRD